MDDLSDKERLAVLESQVKTTMKKIEELDGRLWAILITAFISAASTVIQLLAHFT